jgi:hypothetical protein
MVDNTISDAVNKYHESKQEPPRPHIGCSTLGHACDRWLWLSFRWAVVEKFDGRILRLFRRGQLEESTVVSDLNAAGFFVTNTGAKQSRVDFGTHVSGSVDGIITGGIPDAENVLHVLEIKTHSLKSFNDLQKNGVKKSKYTHYVQMQCYMLGLSVDHALYYAICKDNDEVYTERVKFDESVAKIAIKRGKRLALDDRMPPPLSTDSSWYECKFCAAHDFCHNTKMTKEVNCRTCAHSTATENSSFLCERVERQEIPINFQRIACNAHVLHPDLVPFKQLEPIDKWTACYEIEGKAVANGEGDAHVFMSREIVANPSACASGDKFVSEMREIFGAKVVG